MTMVPWTTMEPAQTEKLVGIFLCREHKYANRIRPASGDRGIDVLVPVGDGRVDVYQVKYFSKALASSQRTQIEKSLARAVDNPLYPIRDWHLAVPLNPTPDNLVWLQELGDSAPFACHWYGLEHLEGLAAKYQDVVDYYLGDGRARLERSIEQLRALVGLTEPSSGQLLSPSETVGPLRDLHRTLNRDDPHFRYDFEVSGEPPHVEMLVERPFLVASCTRADDEVAITHHVYARYTGATEDAPVPLAFTVELGRIDEATAAAWDKAVRYGTPAELPMGAVSNASFGLPGGLASTASEAAIRVSPARHATARPYRMRLRILRPDGGVEAEVTADMEPVTRGFYGGGARAHGREEGGAFDIEILTDFNDDGTVDKANISLTCGEFVGVAPARIRRGVRFLGAMRRPNRLQVAPEYGPAAPTLVEIPVVEAPVTPELVSFIGALADLQELVCASLQVPELDELSDWTVHEVLRGAALARGETVTATWTERSLSMTLDDPPSADGPVQLALSGSYRIDVGEQTISLDPVTSVLLAAELVSEPTEGGFQVRARPALGNNTMLMRLAPMDQVGFQHVE